MSAVEAALREDKVELLKLMQQATRPNVKKQLEGVLSGLDKEIEKATTSAATAANGGAATGSLNDLDLDDAPAVTIINGQAAKPQSEKPLKYYDHDSFSHSNI